MAKKDNDDANDYDEPNEPKPPRRKKRDLDDWANSDRTPMQPNPGQILRQRRKKD